MLVQLAQLHSPNTAQTAGVFQQQTVGRALFTQQLAHLTEAVTAVCVPTNVFFGEVRGERQTDRRQCCFAEWRAAIIIYHRGLYQRRRGSDQLETVPTRRHSLVMGDLQKAKAVGMNYCTRHDTIRSTKKAYPKGDK